MHNRTDELKALIKTIPDFPKKGIMFRDITSLLKAKGGMSLLDYVMEASLYDDYDLEYNKIVAIESRGFILGSSLASIFEVPLVLARKPGKLPNETLMKKYSLEYGEDALCIQTCDIDRNDRVLVVDDVIATGNSLKTVCDIIDALGGKVAACYCLIELDVLNGRKVLEDKGIKLITSINY